MLDKDIIAGSPHSTSHLQRAGNCMKRKHSSCPRKCVAFKVKPRDLNVSNNGRLETANYKPCFFKYFVLLFVVNNFLAYALVSGGWGIWKSSLSGSCPNGKVASSLGPIIVHPRLPISWGECLLYSRWACIKLCFEMAWALITMWLVCRGRCVCWWKHIHEAWRGDWAFRSFFLLFLYIGIQLSVFNRGE